MKLLKDIAEPWAQFVRSIKGLGSRLSVVLVQLPPRFAYNDENMSRVGKLAALAKRDGIAIAVEFRNDTWLVPAVYSKMRAINTPISGTVIKRAGVGKWLGTMPSGMFIPPRTGPFSYTRIHGAKGYRGLYDAAALKTLKKRIADQNAPRDYVFFNNSFYGKDDSKCPVTATKAAAVCDAVMFKEIVGRS
jgi:uncharacterized protein YecE (DUF72 family)